MQNNTDLEELENKIHTIVCDLGNSETVTGAKMALAGANKPFGAGKVEGLIEALHYSKIFIQERFVSKRELLNFINDERWNEEGGKTILATDLIKFIEG